MDNKSRSWLYDILNAIHEIDGFFDSHPKFFEAYQNDIKTKRAVERNIEIIGEAMNRLLNQNPDMTIQHARNIVDTRNRLTHGYDEIEVTQIWNIIINHLPLLKNEVKNQLEN